ncbi:MAG: alpha/beta hydrolase [Bacteroidia bacterium]
MKCFKNNILKVLVLVSILSFLTTNLIAQNSISKSTIAGQLFRFENFKSKFVDARTIDIWLPNNYSSKNKYSVIYMHDGQMLFDSTTTWNKQEWNVDEHISKLLNEEKIENCIVVGIYNNGSKRHLEFTPQKALELFLNKAELDSTINEIGNLVKSPNTPLLADNYLKFIVKELKPFVDKKYSTYKDKKHTSIMGSSMGGLISMYAVCEYPKVFGNAACLSTHWPLIFRKGNPGTEAIFKYLDKKIPAVNKKNRFYFDCGTATLDAMYPEFQSRADFIFKTKMYNSKQFESRIFPGEDHSEKAWSKRFDIPLNFLIGKHN